MKQELSRQEKRKAWLWAALIVAGMAALAGLIWWGSTWEIWEKKGERPPTKEVGASAALVGGATETRAKSRGICRRHVVRWSSCLRSARACAPPSPTR